MAGNEGKLSPFRVETKDISKLRGKGYTEIYNNWKGSKETSTKKFENTPLSLRLPDYSNFGLKV